MTGHDREFAQDLLAVRSPSGRVRLARTSREAQTTVVVMRRVLRPIGGRSGDRPGDL